MDRLLSDLDLDLDLELEEDVVACVALAISHTILLYGAWFDKTPQHTSVLSGQLWIAELLCGHDI